MHRNGPGISLLPTRRAPEQKLRHARPRLGLYGTCVLQCPGGGYILAIRLGFQRQTCRQLSVAKCLLFDYHNFPQHGNQHRHIRMRASDPRRRMDWKKVRQVPEHRIPVQTRDRLPPGRRIPFRNPACHAGRYPQRDNCGRNENLPPLTDRPLPASLAAICNKHNQNELASVKNASKQLEPCPPPLYGKTTGNRHPRQLSFPKKRNQPGIRKNTARSYGAFLPPWQD